jgi:hypothetical protein
LGPCSAAPAADATIVSSLSALTDSTIDPLDVTSLVQARVAQAAAMKVLKVQADMSRDVLRLLDPAAGTRINRSA